MRGHNEPSRPASACGARFTPTCVGTMAILCWRQPLGAVHPHMRGDNDWLNIAQVAQDGSPPHAWGQLQKLLDKGATHSVHPHMRGDNAQADWRQLGRNGSP